MRAEILVHWHALDEHKDSIEVEVGLYGKVGEYDEAKYPKVEAHENGLGTDVVQTESGRIEAGLDEPAGVRVIE